MPGGGMNLRARGGTPLAHRGRRPAFDPPPSVAPPLGGGWRGGARGAGIKTPPYPLHFAAQSVVIRRMWPFRSAPKVSLKRVSELQAELDDAHVAIAWLRRAVKELNDRVRDRKSTRLNSSHSEISYAVFC